MDQDSKSKRIRYLVEFYFSDYNAPDDKFLRRKIADGIGGFVPLDLIIHFGKLREITTDVEVVAKALAPSKELQVSWYTCRSHIQLSDDKLFVRRREPMPSQNERIKRTVYVKGFPPEATVTSIAEWAKPYGTVLSVNMRENEGGQFKGSAYIELSRPDEARALVDAKPAVPLVIADDQHACIMLKSDYLAHKSAKFVKPKEMDVKNVSPKATEIISTYFTFGKHALIRVENVPRDTSEDDVAAAVQEATAYTALCAVPSDSLKSDAREDESYYVVLASGTGDVNIPWASSNVKLKGNVVLKCYVMLDEADAISIFKSIKLYYREQVQGTASHKRARPDGRGRGRGRGSYGGGADRGGGRGRGGRGGGDGHQRKRGRGQ